jgi:hypothetical protein
MKSKTIFKEKDRVYVTSLGWGKVIDAGCSTPTGWVGIETNSGIIVHVDTYLVSFTEYTLEGFSQDRPEPAPEIGQVVWGKGTYTTNWSIGYYLGKEDNSYKISSIPNALSYWLAFIITTKNPYENN